MMRNEMKMVEYKNFAIVEEEIDMILSAMAVEHIIENDGRFVTVLMDVEPEKEYAIKRHLDAVLN